MRYAKLENYSIANGPGVRTVLWCQGCRCNCPGCHNPETHCFTGGKKFTEEVVHKICEQLDHKYISGLTLSGGHPLEPENLEVCTKLVKYLKTKYPEKSIWLYTGFLWENIKSYEIFKYIDVCVDGPFILSKKDISLPWSGSSNQRIIDVQKSLSSDSIVLFK